VSRNPTLWLTLMSHRFVRAECMTDSRSRSSGEGESRRIQCMDSKCKMVIDERTIELLVSPATNERCALGGALGGPCVWTADPDPLFGLSVNKVQIPAQPILRRRRPPPPLVPRAQLRVCSRVPSADKGSPHHRTLGQVRVRESVLLRLRTRRSSAVLLRAREEVAQEVQGRFRDCQLDFGQYQGVPQVPGDD
jgi:hypothetical protein